MKKFSKIILEEKKTIEVQEGSVNYLTKQQLEDYLNVASKFISEPAKKVCKWLIDNNDTYQTTLQANNGKSDNILADFYNGPAPKDDSLKDLYKWIGEVVKSGKILEIPVFQKENEFNAILKKELSPDEVILDLESEAGRTEVVKRFTPLVHKIVHSWLGKTSFGYDDLYSYGMAGLTYAMNSYGKKSKKKLKKEEETGIEIDISKYKTYTFLQYAAQMIRCEILEATKNYSHLVRIPISRQKKEKDEKGFIAKSNSVSGDRKLGGKDGDEGKSLFDLVGDVENPGKEIDRKEIDDLWKEIMDKLEEKFGEKTMDIFYNHFGWGGRKKISGKEMAKKYGYNSPSSITAEIVKVINYIKKDPKMFAKFQDIYELVKEVKHDEDEYDNDNEPVSINRRIMEERMFKLNDVDGE